MTERLTLLIDGHVEHLTPVEVVTSAHDWKAVIDALTPEQFEAWWKRLSACLAHSDSERAACPLCREDAV